MRMRNSKSEAMYCTVISKIGKALELPLNPGSILTPIFTSCGNTDWKNEVANMAKMSFLRMLVGLSFRNRVKSSDICVKMLPGHLPLEVLWTYPIGRRPQSRPKTCWGNMYPIWPWNWLRIPQEELESVGRGMTGIPCSACWYCDLISDRWKMNGWMHGFLKNVVL